MFPDLGDQAFLDAALSLAHADGTDPTVRGALLDGTDNLVRRLRARGELDRAGGRPGAVRLRRAQPPAG